MIGVGTLGALAIALLRLHSPSRIVAFGVREEELELARASGITRVMVRDLRVLGLAERGNRGLELLGEAVALAGSVGPRLEQIHALIERSRSDGRRVEFRVDGEPAALLAGVDLVTYRIVEEILGESADGAPVSIELRIGDQDLELEVDAAAQRDVSWPTPTIRERVALYDGQVAVADAAGRFLIRLPRQTEGAMA